MEKEQEIIRTSLRLPKRLYDQIAKISDERGLTMHAEIINMLNDAVEMANYVPQENKHPDEYAIHLPHPLAEKISQAAEKMKRTTEDQVIDTLERMYLPPK